MEPYAENRTGNTKTLSYRLADGQVYNYRTSRKDGITHAGYFTMSIDPAKCPDLRFAAADYSAYDPKAVNHDANANGGYETGDIFLNINERHHLQMHAGDVFESHAMRTWELTDNSTNNYFMDPDFHYTVLDLSGKPSHDVVRITQKPGSSWADIEAVGQGTAIVLVTYDGICVDYYGGKNKNPYMGGEYWGAIWPENTGVFVVSVDTPAADLTPGMEINADYNLDTLKMAGKKVDAEHDVFYYLDSEPAASYTFKPEGVADVELAYPVAAGDGVTYRGFSHEGVTANADGSYTLLLKNGRQIVRLTDNAGNCAYQVLKARECHREITNATREGSHIFQPGDKIKVQYTGLFHPANKIAGIYNMSAYVTYNGVPNGTDLILGSGQYTFGSSASAQCVTFEIPATYDAVANPEFKMDKGVIQVNGFGDPIGNHRTISRTAGRSPNFTAVGHKTYFGLVPDINISLSPIGIFQIQLDVNVEDADVALYCGGKKLEADARGLYSGTYGAYQVVASKAGYRCLRQTYDIGDDAEGLQTFAVELTGGDNLWDGVSATAPRQDTDGTYIVQSPDELAWIAKTVNAGTKLNARLEADIDLAGYDWTPIGTSSKAFSGTFDGRGHEVRDLYINQEKTNYQGLFGYIKGASADSPASVSGVTVSGRIAAKQYSGGVAGYVGAYSSLDRCANLADVSGTSYIGGVAGYLYAATSSLTNCYNAGNVTASSNCGGVAGYNNASAVIENVHNMGKVSGSTLKSTGACVGGTTAKTNVKNAFAVEELGVNASHTIVDHETMASGEVAYKLGEAFSQTIGEDEYPVFGSLKVWYDADTGEYYNEAQSFSINAGEGNAYVEVTEDGIVMQKASAYQLTLTAEPALARLPQIEWASDHTETAAVDGTGTVEAHKVGTAKISATGYINGTEHTSTINVTVVDDTVGMVEISAIDQDALYDVYDLDGKVILKSAPSSRLCELAPGVYVISRRGEVVKLNIR